MHVMAYIPFEIPDVAVGLREEAMGVMPSAP